MEIRTHDQGKPETIEDVVDDSMIHEVRYPSCSDNYD